jgi:ribonuclease R
MRDQPDYRLELDEHGKISAIRRQEKSAAHRLVEECMVATNRCAADFLPENAALFVCHNGFRSERREAIERLVAEQLPALQGVDIGALPGYIALLQAANRSDQPLPLRAILLRCLERSQLRGAAAPHFGMGLPRYTTITSPIRKFNDFLLHRLIAAKLRGEPLPAIDEQQIAQLQERSDRVRQASQLAEQWLQCEYLQQRIGARLQGAICHINSSGFSVRLHDTGIEGFVDLRHAGEKFSFDNTYLRLSSATRQFQLEQEVAVPVAAVDMKKRTIAFQLAPQKETPPADTGAG